MQIRIAKPREIRPHEITPEGLYLNRRQAVRALLGAAGASAAAWLGPPPLARATEPDPSLRAFEDRVESPYRVDDPPTDYGFATRYNNFYEFSSDKESPATLASSLETTPWSVAIEGAVAKPGVVPLETLLEPHPLEERIYRFRCVEAWSMVIPWVGIPLRAVLERFEPESRAKFVAFETLYRPEQMPEQKTDLLDWPYTEGLRIDEAMHPLTLLAVGMYGRELPNQNGAPLRLVVPWKYGFKSIKSIVKIRLTTQQPPTTWNLMSPGEYGFLANVNPEVSHPRWSQARERRLGEFGRRETLPFNGYQDEVASLYAGIDLEKRF